jgi:hypothetical protein
MLATDAKPSPPAPKTKTSGAGFFQRVSSFLVGAGFTALASQYYIFRELHDGNASMLKKQKEIEQRLNKLEKK